MPLLPSTCSRSVGRAGPGQPPLEFHVPRTPCVQTLRARAPFREARPGTLLPEGRFLQGPLPWSVAGRVPEQREP